LRPRKTPERRQGAQLLHSRPRLPPLSALRHG
jgi:hypothetical protein